MNEITTMAVGLALLSIASGMLGLGVAFAAVPFLGIFLHDFVHEVQPLSLLLNGITALFSLLGFARSGLVMWRPAVLLAFVTTLAAPIGAYLAQIIDPNYLWAIYFVAVVYLAYRMFLPEKVATPGGAAAAAGASPSQMMDANLRLALILAAPISVLAGMLGVGPGFLLMPTLILVGFDSKHAAAMNAFAVTPPSFSALLPHVATASIDPYLATVLVLVGAIGAFVGARVTSLYVPDRRLKQMFGVLIVVLTAYKLYQIGF